MRNRAAIAAVLSVLGACTSPGVPSPDGDAAETIPEAAQGRWGLTAADCTPPRAQALGLLVVGPNTLEFYESRGVLRGVEERSPTRIVGRFAFSGEGEEWSSRIALEARDGGETLVRRELGEDATPEAIEYVACG